MTQFLQTSGLAIAGNMSLMNERWKPSQRQEP